MSIREQATSLCLGLIEEGCSVLVGEAAGLLRALVAPASRQHETEPEERRPYVWQEPRVWRPANAKRSACVDRRYPRDRRACALCSMHRNRSRWVRVTVWSEACRELGRIPCWECMECSAIEPRKERGAPNAAGRFRELVRSTEAHRVHVI